MNKLQFLAQPDVDGFIQWLCRTLPNLKVHLHFASSKFVPGGLNKRVTGIQGVHAEYHWRSAWNDPVTGNLMVSDDWPSTKRSLERLRDCLLTALASGCNTTTYQACRAVLQWGGVWGAVPFLGKLSAHGKLVAYLNGCRALFALNAGQSLSQLSPATILRFDAGLTKVHSLIDTSGSPIYDSRVGAAIAMLYALYRISATGPAELVFPSGAARGAQIRDPGALGYQKAPQFFSKAVPGHAWARSQVELGWIIEETLKRSPSLFAGTLPERCHQFEAALFMIGYDLRCLVPTAHSVAAPAPAVPPMPAAKAAAGKGRTTWVPTSVPFPQVLWDYLECSRSAGEAVALSQFRQWQVQAKGRTASTAQAYCAPLRPREFDLVSFELDDLERIAQGGEAGLQVLGGGATAFIAGDEYEQVYLTNVYLCGRAMALADCYSVSPMALLLEAGCAGDEGTAKLILRTGQALGQHFGLLVDARATALFARFFGEALGDCEAQLLGALDRLSVTA